LEVAGWRLDVPTCLTRLRRLRGHLRAIVVVDDIREQKFVFSALEGATCLERGSRSSVFFRRQFSAERMDVFNLGKWFDPISERWIEEREVRPVPSVSRDATKFDHEDREVQRIWQAVIDSAHE
jgi:hypothetical protein